MDWGWNGQFNFTRNGRVIGFYLKLSERNFIEVFETKEVVPTVDHDSSLGHYCLETDDMEAVRQRFVDKGFAPGEIKMGADNSLQFWITDPSGVPFEFHQYTDRSAQFDPSGARRGSGLVKSGEFQKVWRGVRFRFPAGAVFR